MRVTIAGYQTDGAGEKIEKFCVGPTRFNPGPILFNTVTTEVKFVEKSNSSTLIRSIEVSSSTK
mgnify:CR=1 FL=1